MQAAEQNINKRIHAISGDNGIALTELRVCYLRQLNCLSWCKVLYITLHHTRFYI